jgi:hypothetical protein
MVEPSLLILSIWLYIKLNCWIIWLLTFDALLLVKFILFYCQSIFISYSSDFWLILFKNIHYIWSRIRPSSLYHENFIWISRSIITFLVTFFYIEISYIELQLEIGYNISFLYFENISIYNHLWQFIVDSSEPGPNFKMKYFQINLDFISSM